MTALLWQPSEASIKKTQMFQFMQQLHFDNYADFYRWSISDIGAFWEAAWQFFQIRASKLYEKPVELHHDIMQTRWFPGALLNFAENLLVRRDEKTAIIAYDETGRRRVLTYKNLYEDVAALANALKQHGIEKGDRVAAYLPNMPETIIGLLATSSLGAIYSSCSPDFGVQGVIDRFEQIQPKILIATDGQYYHGKANGILEKISTIIDRVPSIEKVVVVPFLEEKPVLNHLKSVLYTDFITEATTLTFEPVPFDHPLCILYSSGTTGKPKCIVHSVGGTLIQHLKELRLHTDLSENDVFMYYTTCGWMMWNWMVSGLATGCMLILYDGSPAWPNPAALFDIIEREKITVFGTSAKYIAMLEKEKLDLKNTHDLTALRCVLSTGSPLSPESFDYVYQHIGTDIQLSSISGGTDIVSCFALGNPILPVYRSQLQCRGLGLAVEIYNEAGESVLHEKGELVCTKPFPCMPIYFWNDPLKEKYHAAYFSRFDNVWAHGDYAEITTEDGIIIYGRSDTVLNPGGVRIGTAEIYRQVEKVDAVLDSIVVGQDWDNDIRVILFVKLRPDIVLDETLEKSIRKTIRDNASPRHVPAIILQVYDIPRTFSGKIAELAVRNTIHGQPVQNKDALANPRSLEEYQALREKLYSPIA